MSFNITQYFGPGDNSVCYLKIAMAPELIPIPCGESKEDIRSAMEIADKAMDSRSDQIVIPVNKSGQYILIFSRGGGITFSLGIDDYSSFISPYLGDDYCIHEFYKNDSKYVTIIKKSIVKKLCGLAKEIWKVNKKGTLLKIMLSIDSAQKNSSGSSGISNNPIDHGVTSNYFDITGFGETLDGFSLQPKVTLNINDVDQQGINEILDKVDQLNQDNPNMKIYAKIKD